MGKTLRAIAARFPGAAAQYRRLRGNVRDVRDMYVSRPVKPVDTPLGFKFGGLTSTYHAQMQRGTFEADEVRLLRALFPYVELFVDVGANVGYFTCLARYAGLPAVAIEPMPGNLQALFENLRANGWTDTEVLPMGASDHAGIQTLYGASSTSASLIDRWNGAPSTFKRTICTSTLERMLGRRTDESRILLKMDVEGHEYPALLGARALLSSGTPPLCLIEITLQEYHPDGGNPHFRDCFDLFFTCGYQAFLLAGNELRLVTVDDVAAYAAANRTGSVFVNYLFVPGDMDKVVPVAQAALQAASRLV